MSFLPVNNYEIKTSAKPSEIAAALGAHVQSFPIVTRLGGHKTFAGSVSETGFRFVRVGDNRNSFRPTVSGIFLSDSQNTIIQIAIKHDAYFFIPLIIMVLLFGSLCLQLPVIPLLIAYISNNVQDIQKYISYPYWFFLLSPIAILFIGYFFGVLFFESEARTAQEELARILAPFVIKPEISGQ